MRTGECEREGWQMKVRRSDRLSESGRVGVARGGDIG